MVDLFLITVILVGMISILILFLLPRYGPHYRSRLTCPKCKKEFTFHWLPGGSFLSFRSGKLRRLRCPYCHEHAMYNITATRIRKDQTS
jgi:DNA-directed RNA polymerase subunit RPC12/RpoP